MYCRYCGAHIEDTARFCSACGHETVAETVKKPVNPDSARDEAKSRLANQILTWGILSLAFSCTFIFSLLGFIFSFVAKSKVNKYVRQFGQVEYRSRVGRDLSTAGFIVGLILTIFASMYLFVIFAYVWVFLFGL